MTHQPFEQEKHMFDKTANLRTRFPVGASVRVNGHPRPQYEDALGVVVGYDAGEPEDAATVVVRFTPPVMVGLRQATRDTFYDDEIVLDADVTGNARRFARLAEDRATLLALARTIESAMDEICELSQKNPDIGDLLPRSYPFAKSLDEVSCDVNVWRFAMQEDGRDE